MAEIIIQRLNQRNQVMWTDRFHELPVTIGRGFDNDLILSDAYACANHARIDATDAGWRIDDLASKNGVYVRNRKETVKETAVLNSGDVIVIGKTHLRAVSPIHPVHDTKKIQLLKQARVQWRVPLLAWCVTLISILMVLFDFYLDIGDNNLSEELLQATIAVLVILGLIFVWTVGWSFVGRVLKNQTQFHYHLMTAACGFVLVELTMYANNFIGYNACNAALRGVSEILLPVIILGALFTMSISAATRLPKFRVLLASLFFVVLSASVFIFAQTISQNKFRESPRFDAVLYAPWAKVVDGQTIDQIMEGNERLFRELDR